jgi:hypothetical protein
LERQVDARGYGFSKGPGLRNFARKRWREETARTVVDIEARAEGGNEASALVCIVCCWWCMQTWRGCLFTVICPRTQLQVDLLGVGLGGDSSPRMIAFQTRFEFRPSVERVSSREVRLTST